MSWYNDVSNNCVILWAETPSKTDLVPNQQNTAKGKTTKSTSKKSRKDTTIQKEIRKTKKRARNSDFNPKQSKKKKVTENNFF